MRSGKFIVARSAAEGFVSLELDGDLKGSRFVVETSEHCAARNGAMLVSGPFSHAADAQAEASRLNKANASETIAWAANDAAKRKAEEIRALQRQRMEVVRADARARGLSVEKRAKPALSRRVLANAVDSLATAEDSLARKAREQREKFAADARRLAAKRSAAGRR